MRILSSAIHSLHARQAFGPASAPVLKCRRMTYWMKRFAFVNPFLLHDAVLAHPAKAGFDGMFALF